MMPSTRANENNSNREHTIFFMLSREKFRSTYLNIFDEIGHLAEEICDAVRMFSVWKILFWGWWERQLLQQKAPELFHKGIKKIYKYYYNKYERNTSLECFVNMFVFLCVCHTFSLCWPRNWYEHWCRWLATEVDDIRNTQMMRVGDICFCVPCGCFICVEKAKRVERWYRGERLANERTEKKNGK